jgi:hypothetical protein
MNRVDEWNMMRPLNANLRFSQIAKTAIEERMANCGKVDEEIDFFTGVPNRVERPSAPPVHFRVQTLRIG